MIFPMDQRYKLVTIKSFCEITRESSVQYFYRCYRDLQKITSTYETECASVTVNRL